MAVLSEMTMAYGRRAATGLLGLDALYRAESGDEVGLVVLNMDLENDLVAQPFGSYREATTWFENLRGDAATLAEDDRRLYYQQLCHSTLAFITWRVEGLDFRRQLGFFLHVPVEPAAEAELDELRRDIGRLLDALGYEGDLGARCTAWEARNKVPAHEVPDVLGELMDEAWDRTDGHLLDIPAPKSDGMRVSTVSSVPYNARCDYLNRTIQLNVDPVLTRAGLKHLAVHEGYPGHYVQFKLRESMYRDGRAAADVLLSVVNTASSSVFEGIADMGIAMLGWIEDDNDRVQSLLNRYRAGICTVAAWKLHALNRPEEEVADWLRAHSLVGGEGWVDNRMRFIAAPSRAVLIWSYWWGEPSVAAAWNAVRPEKRAGFLPFLYGRMHSVDTVGMFGKATSPS